MTEAERLAKRLTAGWSLDLAREAAAELRRLDEAHDWQHRMAGERLRRIEVLDAESARRLRQIEQHCYEKDRLKAECNRLASALKQLVIATKHLHPCPGTLDIAEQLIGETK